MKPDIHAELCTLIHLFEINMFGTVLIFIIAPDLSSAPWQLSRKTLHIFVKLK